MSRVIWASLVAALGGLLFGFDTAVISGAEGILRDLYDPTYQRLSGAFGTPAFWHGTLVASALIGTIIGSLVFSKTS